MRLSGPIDIHVISQETESASSMLVFIRRRHGRVLPPRRRLFGWVLVAGGLPVVTVGLTSLRSYVALGSALLLYLLFVVVTAAVGGFAPAIAAAVAGSLLVNWYFTPPIGTWSIAESQNVLALVVYLSTAAIVSALVAVAARRSAEAARATAEAETLAAAASGAVGADPLPILLAHLRTAFGLDGVAVLRNEDGAWVTETGDGNAPTSPEEASDVHDLGPGLVLVLRGPALAAEDRRVLNAFAANLAGAVDRRRLNSQAGEAAKLFEANQFREALLQAVSHDLGTPLASVKASVSSLRQPDIEWLPQQTAEFLATIEDETDRLTNLVVNLLDMSRLRAEVVAPTRRPTSLEEVIPAALASLGPRGRAVEVDMPDDVPPVDADPTLLERVVANLVDNALAHAGGGGPARVEAGSVGDRVWLRVIDRGPGISSADRERVCQPFQRVGDSGHGDAGVGLGLAVARGFTRAIGGQLIVEDTPGGGTTMVVDLKASL